MYSTIVVCLFVSRIIPALPAPIPTTEAKHLDLEEILMTFDNNTFEDMWAKSMGAVPGVPGVLPKLITLISGPLNFTKMDYSKMVPLPEFQEKIDEYVHLGRSAVPHDNERWVDNITFQLDLNFTDKQRSNIMEAIQELANGLPCLKFRVYVGLGEPSFSHVYVRPGTSCSSRIGRGLEKPRQFLNLKKSCFGKAVIQHEMLHALGFLHEHSRPDRDQYITLLMENIPKSRLHDFVREDESRTLNFVYDYYSVMHYPATGRSGKVIIETKKPGVQLGQREMLTETDWYELGNLYGCFGDVYNKMNKPKFYNGSTTLPRLNNCEEFKFYGVPTTLNCSIV